MHKHHFTFYQVCIVQLGNSSTRCGCGIQQYHSHRGISCCPRVHFCYSFFYSGRYTVKNLLYQAAGLNFFILLIYWVLKTILNGQKKYENCSLFCVVIMLKFILNSFPNNFIPCSTTSMFVEKCIFLSMWLLHLQITHFLVIIFAVLVLSTCLDSYRMVVLVKFILGQTPFSSQAKVLANDWATLLPQDNARPNVQHPLAPT